MAALPAAALGARAERVAAVLRASGWDADVIEGASAIGGGSAPGATIPTRLLAIARPPLSADALDARLRALDPPIIARIESGRVVLDFRTVEEGDDAGIVASLVASGEVPGV
jgi:L-seryl-tRNA(Ser) seleniumtransferase